MKKPFWKKTLNAESTNSHWEILNTGDRVELLYVPKDNYSDKDISIEVSHEEFEELLEFMKKLIKKH